MNAQREKAFNRALGLRLMVLRQRRKLSQEYLGEQIGVSGQQLAKYENGINRITPEKLAQCAKILDTPIAYFFDEEGNVASKYYSKSLLLTASEIDALPEDVRRAIHHLARVIEKTIRIVSNDNTRL